MRMMRFKTERDDYRYPWDVAKIQSALAANGIFVPSGDCHAAWEAYSESMCAGWLGLPDTDEEIISCIMPFLTEGV